MTHTRIILGALARSTTAHDPSTASKHIQADGAIQNELWHGPERSYTCLSRHHIIKQHASRTRVQLSNPVINGTTNGIVAGW